MLSIKEYLQHPDYLSLTLLQRVFCWLPDVIYLRLLYRHEMGKWPNLKNPKTFNEKLNWLKLYNRRPEYTNMVDKGAVKNYVAKILGSEYVIRTIGEWNQPEEIDWDSLPEQFVLKTTHGGGSVGVIVCKNKKTFNRKEAIEKLKKSMKQDLYKVSKEWPYKNVPRRIIAEEYITSTLDKNDLPDYKFFCFNGEVKGLFVATERQKEGEDVKFDFFDAEFNHLPFRQGHQNASTIPAKPVNFEKMKAAASKLSKGFPHVRVDMYDCGDRILFGEFTFYHFGGIVPFNPPVWDERFGEYLTLPEKTVE